MCSSHLRCFWILERIGSPFQHHQLSNWVPFQGEHHQSSSCQILHRGAHLWLMIIVRSCPIRSVQKYRASEELLCTTSQRENCIIVCSVWGVHGVRTVYESSFYLIADELIRMHKGCSRLHSIQCLNKLLVHDKQNN